jgi:hypothetical protein
VHSARISSRVLNIGSMSPPPDRSDGALLGQFALFVSLDKVSSLFHRAADVVAIGESGDGGPAAGIEQTWASRGSEQL